MSNLGKKYVPYLRQDWNRDMTVATGPEISIGNQYRSDDTDAYEQRARIPLQMLAAYPMTLSELKLHARQQRIPVVELEETLYWLLARGRVVRADGLWRLA